MIGVATEAGRLTLMPALTLEVTDTTADFDARFPDGADYVWVLRRLFRVMSISGGK